MTVFRVKEKLLTHCGSSVGSMALSLKDWDGKLMAVLSEDSRPLGYYSPMDGRAPARAAALPRRLPFGPGAALCLRCAPPARRLPGAVWPPVATPLPAQVLPARDGQRHQQPVRQRVAGGCVEG